MELRPQDGESCQVCFEQPQLEPVRVDSRAHELTLYRMKPQMNAERPEEEVWQ